MTNLNGSNDNNKDPLVSVGIMAYNRPAGLRQTLECITGQTYKNLQIVVSNNCSPDPEVEKIMLEYAAKDNRIIPFSQSENIGPGANIKFVLDQATGEYFMWAADDDYWEPEFIEKMLRLLQDNQRAVAAFCAVRIKETGKIIDYLERCPNLASPNVNKRLLAYLSWPEGANTKGSLYYGLHRRENMLYCFYKVWPSHSPKSIGPDIIMLYELLIRGMIAFSHEPLYTVTMDNVKYVGFVYQKNKFFHSQLLLIARKWLDIFIQREKFYFLVSKTMLRKDVSIICFFYSLYITIIRHLHALWSVARYGFKKIL